MASGKGWASTKEAMEKQGSSTFLRLENDGDSAVVAFCGEPYHRDICFNEKTNTYEPWDDKTSKALGRKKTTRYAMNVYVVRLKNATPMEMRLFDMNFTTVQQVIALKDKYTLGKCLFEIKRHGAKGDTKTTYAILPDAEITPAIRAACGYQDPKNEDNWINGTVPLLDVEELTNKTEEEGAAVTDDVKQPAGKDGKEGKASQSNGSNKAAAAPAPASPPPPPPPPPNGSNGGAISKATAAELIEKLKVLDKDKGVIPFLARFPYAKKVSEVRAEDEAAARALVAELSGAPIGGEDPFA